MDIDKNRALLLSAKDAAKLIGISRSLFYTLNAEGKIPHPTKLGRRVLWKKSELIAWVEADCPNRLAWEESQKIQDSAV